MDRHEVDKIACAVDLAKGSEYYALAGTNPDYIRQDAALADEMWRTAVALLIRELCS